MYNTRIYYIKEYFIFHFNLSHKVACLLLIRNLINHVRWQLGMWWMDIQVSVGRCLGDDKIIETKTTGLPLHVVNDCGD